MAGAAHIAEGETTWREDSLDWPRRITADRAAVGDADSIGLHLAEAAREGSVVLFTGGWADFSYRDAAGLLVLEAPEGNDPLDLNRFGQLLDRLARLFS